MHQRNAQDFTDYMSFRWSDLEGRVQECVDAIERGGPSIQVDCSDMTSEEQELFKRELQRRINNL